MFSRLCQMHWESESDGEQDFLAAFANYNPGKTTPFSFVVEQSNVRRTHVWRPPPRPVCVYNR